MRFWENILTAGARMFGPPSRYEKSTRSGYIEQGGIAAALVALSAKMAKIDGQVSSDEIAAFRRVFVLLPDYEPAVVRFFNFARKTALGYESYARIIAHHFRAHRAILEDVLDGLFHIALADGIITDSELHFLMRISSIFGFSEREFDRIHAAYTGKVYDDPYLLLGIEETVSDVELKRAYHRMAKLNHPDRLIARGLSHELILMTNHKMATINAAYARIQKLRKNTQSGT